MEGFGGASDCRDIYRPERAFCRHAGRAAFDLARVAWGAGMSDRDAEHILNELQEARAEVDRLRRLIREQTAVMVRGQTFWPDWVMQELGPDQTRPGGE